MMTFDMSPQGKGHGVVRGSIPAVNFTFPGKSCLLIIDLGLGG